MCVRLDSTDKSLSVYFIIIGGHGPLSPAYVKHKILDVDVSST